MILESFERVYFQGYSFKGIMGLKDGFHLPSLLTRLKIV